MKKIMVWLHGDTPTRTDYVLVHSVPLFLAYYMYWWQSVTWTQKIVAFVVTWLVFGGLIAHFTKSTKAFWDSQTSTVRAIYLFCQLGVPFLTAFFFDYNGEHAFILWMLCATASMLLWLLPADINRPLCFVLAIVIYHFTSRLDLNWYFDWLSLAFNLQIVVAFSMKKWD